MFFPSLESACKTFKNNPTINQHMSPIPTRPSSQQDGGKNERRFNPSSHTPLADELNSMLKELKEKLDTLRSKRIISGYSYTTILNFANSNKTCIPLLCDIVNEILKNTSKYATSYAFRSLSSFLEDSEFKTSWLEKISLNLLKT